MGHIIADLKETFRRGNIFIQLIYINVGIFVIGTLIHVFLRLFEVNTLDIFNIFALPASLVGFIHQPWSLFTYMFMHAGILHILFNMLWLYWFGSLFLYFFSAKHLRGLDFLTHVDQIAPGIWLGEINTNGICQVFVYQHTGTGNTSWKS